MRPSLRFLALAVVGWAGFRAWTLGAVPGASFLSITPSEARAAPPLIATQFPSIDPLQPAEAAAAPVADAPPALPASYAAPPALQFVRGVVGVPVSLRRGVVPVYQLPLAVPAGPPHLPFDRGPLSNVMPTPAAAYYSDLPPIDQWPLAGVARMSRAASQSPGILATQSAPVVDPRKIDRLQLTSWALLRSQAGQSLGPTSLASGGQLGGSQAGARLTYNVTRQIAASFRTTTDVGRRGGEVAAGVRVQPLGGIPVWLTVERRQRLGSLGGGRNAFAVFAEGGLFQRQMPWQFSLDAYLQGGIVGFRHRDAFVDGALTLTRPVYKQFSAGLGIWGGAQPGLYRIDAGPRVTMQVRRNVRVHLDWRQRLAGNALPGSGPALTLAGDF